MSDRERLTRRKLHIFDNIILFMRRRPLTMSYYHVLLRFQDEPNNVRCVLSDLSEKQLRTQFVRPYRRGKNILCGREVVDISRIKIINIIRTTDTSDIELKRIQEKSRAENEQRNRSSSLLVVMVLGRGYQLEDISLAGEDVTSKFIVDVPGHDRWTVVAEILNHKWVSTVGAGLVLAALALWFGLK
jgi:hypothetical protein